MGDQSNFFHNGQINGAASKMDDQKEGIDVHLLKEKATASLTF